MTPELIAFLRGRIPADNLPEQIELPQSLWQQMAELWQRSVAEIKRGRVLEWGGVLVLDEEERLRLVNVVAGTGEQVKLVLPSRMTFVGTFHTHPYADGTTGIAFSGADIADAINSGERLSLLQSGHDVFALLRTLLTPWRVSRTLLKAQHKAAHDFYLMQRFSEQDAVHYATTDLCEAYGLAFYSGLAFERLIEVYRP